MHGVDLVGKASIRQTIRIEHRRPTIRDLLVPLPGGVMVMSLRYRAQHRLSALHLEILHLEYRSAEWLPTP